MGLFSKRNNSEIENMDINSIESLDNIPSKSRWPNLTNLPSNLKEYFVKKVQRSNFELQNEYQDIGEDLSEFQEQLKSIKYIQNVLDSLYKNADRQSKVMLYDLKNINVHLQQILSHWDTIMKARASDEIMIRGMISFFMQILGSASQDDEGIQFNAKTAAVELSALADKLPNAMKEVSSTEKRASNKLIDEVKKLNKNSQRLENYFNRVLKKQVQPGFIERVRENLSRIRP